MTFLTLLFAHLLADYPLQGDFIAKNKRQHTMLLGAHAGIWTGMILLATYLLGYPIGLVDVVWLFLVHAGIDYLKARPVGILKKLHPLRDGLLLYQTVHLVQIVILMSYKGMF